MDMADRIVLVTGGTKGLGRAITLAFAAHGATVVCAARTRPAPLEQLAGEGRVIYDQVDVRDRTSTYHLVKRVVASHGRLDVVIANAGVNYDCQVAKLPADEWDAMVATNLTGTLHCIQAAAQPMVDQRGGCIITISSSMARRPEYGAGGYSATKAAIEILTRVAAKELAPAIRVNCVAPGVLAEGMGQKVVANPSLWERYRPQIPLGRAGTAEEAAAAAVFLASDDASYITGAVLAVNGGVS